MVLNRSSITILALAIVSLLFIPSILMLAPATTTATGYESDHDRSAAVGTAGDGTDASVPATTETETKETRSAASAGDTEDDVASTRAAEMDLYKYYLRSDMASNPTTYSLGFLSRIQEPGEPLDSTRDNALINLSYDSPQNAIVFYYPQLNTTSVPLTAEYNSSRTPELSLVINSREGVDKILNFEMRFDEDGDLTTDAIAQFDTYETAETWQEEEINLVSTGWADMNGDTIPDPPGDFTDGRLELAVWRTDNVSSGSQYNTTLQIYCGFHNKTSYIELPYAHPELIPVAIIGPDEDDDGWLDTPNGRWEYENTAVSFDASNSFDPDNQQLSYRWFWGDGTPASQWSNSPTTTHRFHLGQVNQTNYTVRLQIRDTDNNYAEDTIQIQIRKQANQPPTARIRSAQPNPCIIGQTVSFTATATDPDPEKSPGDELFQWDFGDGTALTERLTEADGGGAVEHTYSDRGNYTVTLKVWDNDPNVWDTRTVTKTVIVRVRENEAPVAVAKVKAAGGTLADNVTVGIGQNFTLDGSGSNDPDSLPTGQLLYKWSLGTMPISDPTPIDHDGDGDATNEENYDGDGWITTPELSHAFDSLGSDNFYVITLTVKDGKDSSTDDVTVSINLGPEAVLASPATGIESGERVTLSASSSTDPNVGDTLTYEWDFGDGETETGVELKTLEHTYTYDFTGIPDRAHTFEITVTVTDPYGLSSSDTKTITIRKPNEPPEAQATMRPAEGKVLTTEAITFDGSFSSDPEGSDLVYSWDLNAEDDANGDGVPYNDPDASGEVVNHTYADDGLYIVVLTVTDNEGATARLTGTERLEVEVMNRKPHADAGPDINATAKDGKRANITLSARESYDVDGNISKYEWDFDGDGVTDSALMEPDHTFPVGEHIVTLWVQDDDGARSVGTVNVTVNKPPEEEEESPGFSSALVALAFGVVAAVAILGRKRHR